MCPSAEDMYHHSHRPTTMTTTVIGNSHGDKDDKDMIDMTSPDIPPSEHLRTQKSELAPNSHKFSKEVAPKCGENCPIFGRRKKRQNPVPKIGFEKHRKKNEKRSETCPNRFQPVSGLLKISHRHFSKSFSPPKVCT